MMTDRLVLVGRGNEAVDRVNVSSPMGAMKQ
jgi:hypothetical protein